MTATAGLRVSRNPPLPSPSPSFTLSTINGVSQSAITGSPVYYNGNTYFGIVDGNGNIRVGAYKHSTHAVTISPMIVNIAADLHNSPAVLVRQSDHKLVVAATGNSINHMYVSVSTNAEDVTAWGAATDITSTLGGSHYTYARLCQLSGESGKIYLFYRDSADGSTKGNLCYSTSTDGGATWAAQTVLFSNAGHSPYAIMKPSGTSRIDFVTTDATAPDGDIASLYHFYYDGAWRKSDGTSMGSPPFGPSSPTKIFDGATNGSVRVPYALIPGSNPVTVWVANDPLGSSHNARYWYGIYSTGWTANEIVDSGGAPDSFPAIDEGGICLDSTDSSRVYVSRLNGGAWRMYVYETTNGGSTWTQTKELTTDTTHDGDSVRPASPDNAAAGLLAVWTHGSFFFLTGSGFSGAFGAQIIGYPNPISAF